MPSNPDNSFIRRDSESLERNYRFPFLVVKEADGVYLKDERDKMYLDFTSGGQTANLGHKHPVILEAVKAQMNRTGLAALGWALNDKRVELAEKLIEIVPRTNSAMRVGFCNTGSDATELSLRLAQQYAGKSMVICQFGCYHGQPSMAALAMNTSPHGRRYGVPQIPGIFYVPYPYCYRCLFAQKYPECEFACLQFIEYQFETKVIPEKKVAAFFFEPVQVHGGVIPLPDGYLSRLSEICRSREILLVADEVTTGFGRTGKMFGIEHWDASVDIVYMAKSIASGLSIGAIVANKEIMSNFRGGGTFSGNPLACAASLASIRSIVEQDLLHNCRKMGIHLRKRLEEIAASDSRIGDIRGLGLLIGIELVQKNSEPARTLTKAIIDLAAKSGLLMFPAGVYENVIRLCPPLIAQEEHIDKSTEILAKAFNETRS
jgi:4-aminobutyrate aminotransferase